jgi:hypothetical protein
MSSAGIDKISGIERWRGRKRFEFAEDLLDHRVNTVADRMPSHTQPRLHTGLMSRKVVYDDDITPKMFKYCPERESIEATTIKRSLTQSWPGQRYGTRDAAISKICAPGAVFFPCRNLRLPGMLRGHRPWKSRRASGRMARSNGHIASTPPATRAFAAILSHFSPRADDRPGYLVSSLIWPAARSP